MTEAVVAGGGGAVECNGSNPDCNPDDTAKKPRQEPPKKQKHWARAHSQAECTEAHDAEAEQKGATTVGDKRPALMNQCHWRSIFRFCVGALLGCHRHGS